MPNHFHLLIRQNTELPVSALLLKVCGSYSKIFNKKYDRVGSLFQDQFKAVHVADNTQLLHLSVYMHVNPRLAQLVRDAAKWKYSSYPEYLGLVEGGICDTNTVLGQFKNTRAYEKLVDDSFEDIRARKSAARDLMMDETV
jgi:putative transposase